MAKSNLSEKRIWFFYSPADALAAKSWLNRWAKRGWDLSELTDGTRFLLNMEGSSRTELAFDVAPARLGRTAEELRHIVQEREAQGWIPLATVNGMDLYRSAPCCTPTEVISSYPVSQLVLREVPGFLLWLMLMIGLLVTQTGESWYLGHVSTLFHFSAAPLLVGTGLWLLWFLWHLIHCLTRKEEAGLPGSIALWGRSVLAVLTMVWLWLLLGAFLLGQLGYAYGAGMLFLLSLAVWMAWNRWNQRDSRFGAMVIALILGCGLLLTGMLRMGLPSQTTQLSSAPSLGHLEFDGGSLNYADCTRKGSLLVTRWDYGESWSNDVYVSTQIYHCRTRQIAEDVTAQLCADRQTEKTDLWYSESGDRLLLREGSRILTLWVSGVDLREQKLEAIRAYLNET